MGKILKWVSIVFQYLFKNLFFIFSIHLLKCLIYIIYIYIFPICNYGKLEYMTKLKELN